MVKYQSCTPHPLQKKLKLATKSLPSPFQMMYNNQQYKDHSMYCQWSLRIKSLLFHFALLLHNGSDNAVFGTFHRFNGASNTASHWWCKIIVWWCLHLKKRQVCRAKQKETKFFVFYCTRGKVLVFVLNASNNACHVSVSITRSFWCCVRVINCIPQRSLFSIFFRW